VSLDTEFGLFLFTKNQTRLRYFTKTTGKSIWLIIFFGEDQEKSVKTTFI